MAVASNMAFKLEWEKGQRPRAHIVEGSTCMLSIITTATMLPLSVKCESDDASVQLSCAAEPSQAEWRNGAAEVVTQPPISCSLHTATQTVSFHVFRSYNNSVAAVRTAKVVCRGAGRSASLQAYITHEVLPVFGRVRTVSNGSASTVFEWQHGLRKSVEVVTSKATKVELTPPMRHGVPLFSGGVFRPPLTVWLRSALDNNRSSTAFALHGNDCDNSSGRGCIVAVDADKLVLQLPAFRQVCGKEECVFALEIGNTRSSADGSVGATFSCPHTINSTAHSCFPGMYAIRDDKTSWQPRSSYMLRYVERCHGYLEPGSEECAQQATAHQCAFGIGDDCRNCPSGAECTGGYKIRAFPGYSIKMSHYQVVKCQPPASQRCTGWDAEKSASICGHEYSGSICGLCAEDYYQAMDTTCKPCPDDTYVTALKGAAPFVCALVAAFVSVFLAVWKLESNHASKYRDSPPLGRALRQSKSFCMWLVTSAQILYSAHCDMHRILYT